jgi:hypothetical protein
MEQATAPDARGRDGRRHAGCQARKFPVNEQSDNTRSSAPD